MSDFRATVVIPAFNASRYLAETLDSVLSQTLAAHEILVIDDGSTDATAAVAAKYTGRVTYVRQENRGVSAARNNGLGRATGDWVAFLDADDRWEPRFLEAASAVCRSEPRPALVFTDFRTFGGVDEVVRPSEQLAKWDSARVLLAPTVAVLPSASLVPADSPVRFPEWARNDEDAIFFNECAGRGPVRCVPEVLANYRKHAASAQATMRNELAGCENLLRWAKEREAAHPGLTLKLLTTLGGVLANVRWRRNWRWYWKLRGFCEAHWPPGAARHPELTARVWPPLAYWLKDAFDCLRQRL